MRYASIRKMDISNGEGVGISLFVQGCPYHCKGCFNPETWDFNSGKEWTEEIQNTFLELANKPQIKRVSILGGEPLCEENLIGVWQLIKKIRERYLWDKKIWLYTGSVWEDYPHINRYTESVLDDQRSWVLREIPKLIIQNCNILVDGPYIHELRDISLPFRGSSNQRIIDVQASLKSGEVVLWKKVKKTSLNS